MRKRALACVLGIAASTLTLSAATVVASPQASRPQVGNKVTLITGDVVTSTGGEIAIEPATRTSVAGFERLTKNGDEYVIPAEAAPLVSQGKLDKELFNVTGLIRQRYDDAHTDSVPLLVEQATAVSGARTERAFGELGLTSVTKSKKEPSWRQIAGSGRKVWLNARLRASLDVSVPQVGAPAAWNAGYTGQGVTVAVLDTGLDETHPDVAGKVAVAKDFSGTGSTDDRAGHGTHVASTIVSGDARYRGVAPGAKLAVGKVLDDFGDGQMDDIIAGMRWASAEVKAKVVNMSLGGGESDGTDPLSTAVNELSKANGTLFVIAAGNSGGRAKVSTPASADAALAVASMTKTGAVSDFSSPGPRAGDAAMKPEIAAPGSDIVAARAKNSGGEGSHIGMSGTSMASPHVAGAAAILAGQHPDWTGDAIKSALVSSAAPVNAHPYAVGSGLLDVGRATKSTLQVSPSTVSANLKWPDTKPRVNTVTYRNTGSTAATLNLALDLTDSTGTGAPAGLAKLSASTLTIAPGAQGSVTITATPRAGRPGQYGGALIATTVDGQVTRTPVSVQDEAEAYDLTVNALDRDGKVAEGTAYVVNQDTIEILRAPTGTALRLPAGRYTVMADVQGATGYLARMAAPVLQLKQNTAIRFDARQAKRVSVGVDVPSVRTGFWISGTTTKALSGPDRFGVVYLLNPRSSEVYVASVPGVTSAQFSYYDSYRLEEPEVEMFAETPQRFEVDTTWWGVKPPLGTRRTTSAFGGQGRPEDLAGLSLKDRTVVLEIPEQLAGQELEQRIGNVARTGAAAVALHTPYPRENRSDTSTFPALFLNPQQGGRLVDLAKAGGDITVTLREGGKQRYELLYPSAGSVPANPAYFARTADLAAVNTRYYGMHEESFPRVGAKKLDSPVEVGLSIFAGVQPSSERVEHFTSGKWRLSVFNASDGARGQEVTLTAGNNGSVEWNRAVLGPGFAGTTSSELGEDHPWAYRYSQLLNITVPLFTDAAGHPAVANWEDESTGTGSTSLYTGDRLLGTQNVPGKGIFWVSQADEDFRLTTEVTRNFPWWPASTKVSGDWRFRAPFRQGPFNVPLPLLAIRAEPPVDLGNRSPSGPVTIPLTVTRQDGPVTVTALELEFSIDDGTTWQRADVSRNGDRWQTNVTNPANGFVSLRTKATDSDGNSATITVLRAYQTR